MTTEALTAGQLGWKFIRWGLGLFITGFLTGFVPILHYMQGMIEGNSGTGSRLRASRSSCR